MNTILPLPDRKDAIPTNHGPMSPENVVDYLTYCSYRANRGYGMTAEQLATLFPRSGAAMEARYLEESK